MEIVGLGMVSMGEPQRESFPLGVVPISFAQGTWAYTSFYPSPYGLDDFWEEARALKASLEEIAEPSRKK